MAPGGRTFARESIWSSVSPMGTPMTSSCKTWSRACYPSERPPRRRCPSSVVVKFLTGRRTNSGWTGPARLKSQPAAKGAAAGENTSRPWNVWEIPEASSREWHLVRRIQAGAAHHQRHQSVVGHNEILRFFDFATMALRTVPTPGSNAAKDRVGWILRRHGRKTPALTADSADGASTPAKPRLRCKDIRSRR